MAHGASLSCQVGGASGCTLAWVGAGLGMTMYLGSRAELCPFPASASLDLAVLGMPLPQPFIALLGRAGPMLCVPVPRGISYS